MPDPQPVTGSPPETFTVAKTDDNDQTIFGWAYVAQAADGSQVIDASGEFVDDPGVLEKAAYSFVVDSRDGGVDHQGDPVGTMIESVVFTKQKAEAMGLPAGSMPTGWWVGFAVEDADQYQAIKTGKSAFSIQGTAIKEAVS